MRRVTEGLWLVTGGAALAWLAAGRGDAALALALVLAPMLVVRAWRPDPRVELAFCAWLAAVQVAAGAGALEDLPWLDVPAHLVGAALLCAVLAGRLTAGRAVVVTIALGAGWEVAEAVADAMFGTNYSLGAGDTALDLACDVIGALVAGVVVSAGCAGARPRADGSARPAPTWRRRSGADGANPSRSRSGWRGRCR